MSSSTWMARLGGVALMLALAGCGGDDGSGGDRVADSVVVEQ